MHSPISRQNVYVIGLVALIYSALTVVAAGCAPAHADHHQHHHSEKGSSDHHVLCNWACQATADAADASGSPPTVTELVDGLHDPNVHRLCLAQQPSSVPTRAPPSFPFVRRA